MESFRHPLAHASMTREAMVELNMKLNTLKTCAWQQSPLSRTTLSPEDPGTQLCILFLAIRSIAQEEYKQLEADKKSGTLDKQDKRARIKQEEFYQFYLQIVLYGLAHLIAKENNYDFFGTDTHRTQLRTPSHIEKGEARHDYLMPDFTFRTKGRDRSDVNVLFVDFKAWNKHHNYNKENMTKEFKSDLGQTIEYLEFFSRFHPLLDRMACLLDIGQYLLFVSGHARHGYPDVYGGMSFVVDSVPMEDVGKHLTQIKGTIRTSVQQLWDAGFEGQMYTETHKELMQGMLSSVRDILHTNCDSIHDKLLTEVDKVRFLFDKVQNVADEAIEACQMWPNTVEIGEETFISSQKMGVGGTAKVIKYVLDTNIAADPVAIKIFKTPRTREGEGAKQAREAREAMIRAEYNVLEAIVAEQATMDSGWTKMEPLGVLVRRRDSQFVVEKKIDGEGTGKGAELIGIVMRPCGLPLTMAKFHVVGCRPVLHAIEFLQWLHTKVGYIHRDARLENIVLTVAEPIGSGSVLIDYGFAVLMASSQDHKLFGSPPLCCPSSWFQPLMDSLRSEHDGNITYPKPSAAHDLETLTKSFVIWLFRCHRADFLTELSQKAENATGKEVLHSSSEYVQRLNYHKLRCIQEFWHTVERDNPAIGACLQAARACAYEELKECLLRILPFHVIGWSDSGPSSSGEREA